MYICKTSRKNTENIQCGVWWCLPDQFYCKFENRVVQKFGRIILFLFGLITCRVHFSKNRKASMCMIFGPSGIVHGPKTNHSWMWTYPKIQTIREHPRSLWTAIICGSFENSSSQQLKITCAETSLSSVASVLKNLEYETNVHQKSWIGNLVSKQKEF